MLKIDFDKYEEELEGTDILEAEDINEWRDTGKKKHTTVQQQLNRSKFLYNPELDYCLATAFALYMYPSKSYNVVDNEGRRAVYLENRYWYFVSRDFYNKWNDRTCKVTHTA